MKKQRFKITIDKNGLNDYEASVVNYAFESNSPQDALRRVNAIHERCEKILLAATKQALKFYKPKLNNTIKL